MLGQIKGNYELRIAIIDLDELENCTNFEHVNINNTTEDDEFYSVAEVIGTIYTLGSFIECVNHQELDDLANSYVRAFLVNEDEPSEIIGIDDYNSLYLYSGEVKQV